MSRRWRLPYERLQLLSLLALALLPLLVFSLIAAGRLDFVVSANADEATQKTLNGVSAVVAQRQQELSRTTQGYATWSEFQNHVDAGDSAWLQDSVLDFVVSKGIADAALLRVGGSDLTSGSTGLTATLTTEVSRIWQGEPRSATFGYTDGVYELALWPVGGAAGTPGTPVLALAERLDESFVSDAKAMTGWDVAVTGTDGTIRVATGLESFQRLGRPAGGDTLAWMRQAGGLAGGSLVLRDASGQPAGAVVAVTDLGALSGIADQVLFLLALILAPTVVGALFLSLFLTLRIRRRVRAIERGIAAVASGDLSVRLPTGDRDGFERLASSHNRLAATLEHRDRTLAKLLDAIAALHPDQGMIRIAERGIAAARDIFGFSWCELQSADGSVVVAGRPKDGDGEDGDVAVPHGDERWNLSWGGRPAGWSAADRELLELFGIQLGSALRDAELYERTANRARSLDRHYRLQADFLRGVSHNLQSPLTAIVGLSDDLRSRDQLDDGAKDRAEVIHGEAQRLTRLVRQLLTMSRLEAGTLQVVAELCAPEPIVRRAWKAQRTERSLDLRNEAPGALAVADPQALEQVLWILFDNALRYAPNGPVHVEIGLRPGRRGRRADGSTNGRRDGEQAEQSLLVIRVEDEGPGVPVAERSAIFRRFQRGSTSAGHDGTGLGLDVARGVLRAMDGTITCEAGRIGAAFVIAVPAEIAVAPN